MCFHLPIPIAVHINQALRSLRLTFKIFWHSSLRIQSYLECSVIDGLIYTRSNASGVSSAVGLFLHKIRTQGQSAWCPLVSLQEEAVL